MEEKTMYIKTLGKNNLIDMNRFDGIGIEDQRSGYSLVLFRAEHEPTCGILRKCTIRIGAYGYQQALVVLGEIEQALANGEKLYLLPEPEVHNA